MIEEGTTARSSPVPKTPSGPRPIRVTALPETEAGSIFWLNVRVTAGGVWTVLPGAGDRSVTVGTACVQSPRTRIRATIAPTPRVHYAPSPSCTEQKPVGHGVRVNSACPSFQCGDDSQSRFSPQLLASRACRIDSYG